jgi:hypothetical protein
LIDLSDNNLPNELNFDFLRPEDAFILGAHFERVRLEKDKELLNLKKSCVNVRQLKLVKSDGK